MDSVFKGIATVFNGVKFIMGFGRDRSYDEFDTGYGGPTSKDLGTVKKDWDAINEDWDTVNKDFATIWGYFNVGKRGGKE